jgi:phosphatidylserine/phosphatidylglycerophosphate/cardiolipin synthase-like enzyme
MRVKGSAGGLLLAAALMTAGAAGWMLASGSGPVPASFEGETVLLRDGEFYPSLTAAIDGAKEEVVISTFIFITRGKASNLADRMRDTLIQAAGRGVTVRVLLEVNDQGDWLSAGNRETGRRLAEAGVVVTYDDPRRMSHAKVAVIDRRLTFIGSHNLSDSALKYNQELSVLIDSPETADAVLEYLGVSP